MELPGLSDAGYSRIKQIVRGDLPKIKKFAIAGICGEHWENRKMLETVRRGNYPFIHIKGGNGFFRNPILILNVSDSVMADNFIPEGSKYFISASVMENTGVRFSLMDRGKRRISSLDFIKIGDGGPENCAIFMLEANFIIPFFDKRWKIEPDEAEKNRKQTDRDRPPKEYIDLMLSACIRNPMTGTFITISKALELDESDPVYKIAAEYMKRRIDGYNKNEKLEDRLNERENNRILLRIHGTDELVLDTNIKDPHRISYRSDETKGLLGADDCIKIIKNINAKYEASGEDAFEMGGMSHWGRRGTLLKCFNELQEYFAELN